MPFVFLIVALIFQYISDFTFLYQANAGTWYVGGLNFQVEHHLFPTICHVHYPAVSEIVKETCEEFNVPYLENPTFWTALKSHVRAIISFGKLPDMNEAIG